MSSQDSLVQPPPIRIQPPPLPSSAQPPKLPSDRRRARPQSRFSTPVVIAAAVGAVVLFIIGCLVVPLAFHAFREVTARPNQHNFNATQRWCQKVSRRLDDVNETGNSLVLRKVAEEALTDCDEILGQKIRWSLPVARIASDAVILKSDFSSMVLREKSPYMERTVDSVFREISTGARLVELHIGGEIEREVAERLTSGDYVTITATISDINVMSGVRYRSDDTSYIEHNIVFVLADVHHAP